MSFITNFGIQGFHFILFDSMLHCNNEVNDLVFIFMPLQSLNGVFINGKKLEAMTSTTLHDGDIVQLGVQTSPESPAEFLFQYHTALKVKRVRKAEDTVDGLKSSGKRPRLEGSNEAEVIIYFI